MPLNSSGAISLGGSTAGQSIALELGLSATGQISLNDAAVRGLAGVASGAITMPTNFWGKSNIPEGSLYGFGYGDQGGFGNNTRSNYSTMTLAFGGANWIDCFANAATIAVKSNGTLWAWGYNSEGLLGLNDTINRSSPVQIGALTSWKKVGGGSDYAFAIRSDGTLWGWGNSAGGSGFPLDYTRRSSPVQIGTATNWATISKARGRVSVGTRTDGTVYGAGENNYGQLANNTAEGGGTFVLSAGGTTGWADAAAGNFFGTYLKSDGRIFGAGYWLYAMLPQPGDQYSSPVQIGALTNWAKIPQFNYVNFAAIKSDKTLWMGGSNSSGELGQNNRIVRSSPVQVGAGTDYEYLAWFLANGPASMNVVRSNGTYWSWGSGSGTQPWYNLFYENRSSPAQVGADTNWKNMLGGSDCFFALKG